MVLSATASARTSACCRLTWACIVRALASRRRLDLVFARLVFTPETRNQTGSAVGLASRTWFNPNPNGMARIIVKLAHDIAAAEPIRAFADEDSAPTMSFFERAACVKTLSVTRPIIPTSTIFD